MGVTCHLDTTRFRKVILWLGGVLLMAAWLAVNSVVGAEKPSPGQASASASSRAIDFRRDVAPIFASCLSCHSGEKAQGGLRLDSEAAVLQGGVSGKLVVSGHSNDSLLMKRLLGLGDAPRMPPGSDPLPRAQIDKIRAWIDQGAFAQSGTQTVSEVAWRPSQEAPQVASSSGFPQSGEFAAKIRPLFAERCMQCHGPDIQQNDLRLDSLAAALKGGVSGKVVLPGNSE